MPSWIREKNGIEWYDEAYTVQQTNQSQAQLEKKAKLKKIRRFKQRNGGYWYARPDVESLREAYLKRSKAAKAWKPTDAQLEARHTRQWQRELERERKRRVADPYGSGPRLGLLEAHAEKVLLADIEIANSKRKKRDD